MSRMSIEQKITTITIINIFLIVLLFTFIALGVSVWWNVGLIVLYNVGQVIYFKLKVEELTLEREGILQGLVENMNKVRDNNVHIY